MYAQAEKPRNTHSLAQVLVKHVGEHSGVLQLRMIAALVGIALDDETFQTVSSFILVPSSAHLQPETRCCRRLVPFIGYWYAYLILMAFGLCACL